jgi:flagellar protein FlaF
MYANQLATYKSVQKATMSDREIEASVLTKAALKLKSCQDNWDAYERDANLDEALKFNQGGHPQPERVHR